MLYNVSFMLNGVDCANLVDADADMETVKEYFIHEHLNGLQIKSRMKKIKIGLLEFPKITNLTNQENLCIKCRITGNENKFRNVGDSIKRSRNHERIQN